MISIREDGEGAAVGSVPTGGDIGGENTSATNSSDIPTQIVYVPFGVPNTGRKRKKKGKEKLDLLSDSLHQYRCPECGHVSDFIPEGDICPYCKTELVKTENKPPLSHEEELKLRRAEESDYYNRKHFTIICGKEGVYRGRALVLCKDSKFRYQPLRDAGYNDIYLMSYWRAESCLRGLKQVFERRNNKSDLEILDVDDYK